MNIKEVVFPIDFSDRSIDACPFGGFDTPSSCEADLASRR